MKGLILRLAAVAFGLGLAAVGLEAGLRLVGALDSSPPPRQVAVYEEHNKNANVPSIRLAPRPAAGAERFTILVIGDSFTWGTGVYGQDAYPRRLEVLLERMNRDLDVDVRMITRPGWNTELEYEAARRAIRGLKPQLIILGYCLNDAETRHRENMARMLQPLRRRQPSAIEGFLVRHSRLASLLWNRLENSRQKRAFDDYYDQLYRGAGWTKAQTALDRLRELAWSRRVPLVAVVFPIFDQQFDAGYSYAEIHRTIDAALRARDIPYLDLLDAYRGIDTQRLAVIPFSDPHPNELAHRIASQRLAYFLVEHELVPVSREQRDRVELSLTPSEEPTTR